MIDYFNTFKHLIGAVAAVSYSEQYLNLVNKGEMEARNWKNNEVTFDNFCISQLLMERPAELKKLTIKEFLKSGHSPYALFIYLNSRLAKASNSFTLILK